MMRNRHLALLIRLPIIGASVLLGSCVSMFESDVGPLLSSEEMEKLRTVDPLPATQFKTSPEVSVTEALKKKPTLAPSVLQSDHRIQLTLLEVQRSVLENNLKLQAQYVAPSINQQVVRYEEGKFDSVVSFTYDHERSVWVNTYPSGSSDPIQILPSYQTTAEASLEIPLATGGAVTLGGSTMLDKADINYAQSELYVQFTQPLLKGGGIDYNMGKIHIAQYGVGQTDAQTKLAVIKAVSKAEDAYWLYVASLRNLGVQQKLYKSAVEVLTDANAAFEGGLTSKTSVEVAQMTVAQRFGEVIHANNEAVINMRSLKTIMNRSDMPVDSTVVIEPMTGSTMTYFELDEDALLSLAMKNRADLIMYEMKMAAEAVAIDMARNLTLPQVDLTLGYMGLGLASDSWTDSLKYAPHNQANFDDGFGNQFYPAPWSIALDASMPLGNNEAEAMLSKRILQRIQTAHLKGELRLHIQQQILNAHSTRTARWQEILAAQREVEYAQSYYTGLQALFRRQLATGTDLKVAMQSLASAQRTLIMSHYNYQSANIDLAQATGTLLGRNQVDWSPTPVPQNQ